MLQCLYCVMVCLVTGWTSPKQCSSILMKGVGHCELGNFDGFESHDVMHSLDGDVAGHARIGDAGRAPWWSGRLGDWLVVVVVIGINDVVSGRRCWCSETCLFVGHWP
jgi:hypothetical protein